MYGEIEFECGHWGVFENAIDMAHIHYLHSDSFGNKVRRVQSRASMMWQMRTVMLWPHVASEEEYVGGPLKLHNARLRRPLALNSCNAFAAPA